MRKLIVLALLGAFALAALAAMPASGKTPGQNGRIAFARNDPADTEGETFTYTANPDGSDVRALFPAFHSSDPHWSPDGSEVAVLSGLGQECPPTCTGNTVIIDPDTGDYRVLASQGFPAVETFCSLWSPDATHFVCEGGNDEDSSVHGLYTIRSSDGGGLTRLTDAQGGDDIPIDFSPDGKEIVFGRFDVPGRPPRANSALFVVASDGGAERRITPWGFADNAGSWSPDGTKIAFEHLGSLFTVHPDGTGLAKLPLDLDGRSFAGDVDWSPDGEAIVFLSITQTGAHSFDEGLATANADGGDVRQMTSSPTFDHLADWGRIP